jgi:hypothetical protein
MYLQLHMLHKAQSIAARQALLRPVRQDQVGATLANVFWLEILRG